MAPAERDLTDPPKETSQVERTICQGGRTEGKRAQNGPQRYDLFGLMITYIRGGGDGDGGALLIAHSSGAFRVREQFVGTEVRVRVRAGVM